MIRKLFSIVVSHCSDARRQRSKACNDGLADQVGSFAGDVREGCKTAFALHERHDRLFVTGADYGVDLPVTDLTEFFNRSRTLGNWAPTNDLPATALSAAEALAPLSLATKVFPVRPTLSIVRIDVLVNRFVANGQPSRNLLRTPLQVQPLSDQRTCPLIDLTGIATRLGTLLTKNISPA
jgi:hypothetical protein